MKGLKLSHTSFSKYSHYAAFKVTTKIALLGWVRESDSSQKIIREIQRDSTRTSNDTSISPARFVARAITCINWRPINYLAIDRCAQYERQLWFGATYQDSVSRTSLSLHYLIILPTYYRISNSRLIISTTVQFYCYLNEFRLIASVREDASTSTGFIVREMKGLLTNNVVTILSHDRTSLFTALPL